MVAAPNSSFYSKILRVSYQYLGPATDRFIARQIENHLHKAPNRIKEQDLEPLIDWIRLAMNIVSDDEKLVNQYIAELQSLVSVARD